MPFPVEPHLSLVPSVIWDGKRWRAVFSKLYYRPLTETFHEFLIQVIKWTFGEPWWRSQVGMIEGQRHIVVRWAYQYADLTQKAIWNKDSAPPFAVPANGPTWALLSLGYDLFCLQACNVLPDFVVERLRNRSAYQGARYEIAVAAILMRSGFNITFLDESSKSDKHCEFIATHRSKGIMIGVEAKSRRRPGAVNESGEFSYSEDVRGLENLVRQAKKQGPAGLPFLIFIDLNLPASPGLPSAERPWMKDVMKLMDRLGVPTAESPDPYSALVLTNYAFHFGNPNSRVPKPEWGMVISRYAMHPIDVHHIAVLEETLDRYGVIPAEV